MTGDSVETVIEEEGSRFELADESSGDTELNKRAEEGGAYSKEKVFASGYMRGCKHRRKTNRRSQHGFSRDKSWSLKQT